MAKVTLRDVAEAAGVSIATASWAVNDNRDVQITESTRRKVRRAADELGYHHNALARGLARGRSDIIGFISDGVATSPFAGQVIQGAQDEAWRNGKILLVVDTDGRKDVERRTFSFMFEHQVEGIIGLATMFRQSDEGRMAWDWRPTMAGPKHPRHYDEAFKRQIVQSCESGKPSREIRAGHDIARSTPRRRVQGIRDSGSTWAADNRTPGRNEPVEPGRRNRRLEMEVDVSEQAAPVFARRQA